MQESYLKKHPIMNTKMPAMLTKHFLFTSIAFKISNSPQAIMKKETKVYSM